MDTTFHNNDNLVRLSDIIKSYSVFEIKLFMGVEIPINLTRFQDLDFPILFSSLPQYPVCEMNATFTGSFESGRP